MSVFRGSVRQRQMMPTLRLLIDGFMFGLPVPVLGTLALCAFQGHVVPGAALFLQARSSLLKTADCVPFVFALCALCFPRLRVQTQAAWSQKALTVLMLTLTGLPMLLPIYARHADAITASQLADAGASESLRLESIWLYGAGRPDSPLSLAARTAQRNQMRVIREDLRSRYPAAVAATDAAWARFNADFEAHGQVSRQSATAMCDSADGLAGQIRRLAQTHARHAAHLLFLGTCALELSGLGSLVLLRRLRRSEETQQRLTTILDTTTDLIAMSDPQGQVLYFNTAFRRFLGLPLEGALPHIRSFDLHTPESRAKITTEGRAKALADGAWEGETALIHPSRGPVLMSQVLLAHRTPQGDLDVLSTVARDISGRKSVETALLNAEALFRSALSAMQEGFLVQDIQGKVLMANKHAEEILGLVHDEMIGQAAMRVHWSAIHANGLPFAREDHPSRRVLQTGLPHPATMLGLDKPGQPLQWLSVSASPLFHPGETSPYAAVSTFTDITAQKAAADALRQSQERLQTVVGNAPVILFSLDTEGILTTSEGRGLELLGQKPGQVVGQSFFDLIGNNPRIETHVRRALAGESVSYVSEMAGYQWDNQLRPLLGASGVEGVIGISFDVTDRHQAEEILRRGEERLRSLYEITANPELAFKEKMERLMQMGCLQFGMQAGILAKMDETLYEVVQSYTPGAPSYQGLILPVKNTLCHEAILSGEPLGIENISASSWVTHPACQAAYPEAYLGTEVLVGDKSFGALCFTAAQPHAAPFTAGDKDLLRLMAQWVGSEMLRREAEQKVHDYNIVLEFQTQEMERANRELEGANAQLAALAATDSLTGLCNRRTLGERLAAEFERARRYNSSLSLLMMDVDQFKQYNDAFGHQTGDFVLQTVGQILDSHARITDLAARYGGEEFTVVLPETDAAGALVVAERIRHAMECHEWPQRAVTMSIGVCTLGAGTATADALLADADAALYRSKATGRNRVTRAGDLQFLPASSPAASAA